MNYFYDEVMGHSGDEFKDKNKSDCDSNLQTKRKKKS